MNTPGQVVDLIRSIKRLLTTRCAFDQLRLNLNGGDVLTNFVVQFPRQAFARVFFGADQLFGQRATRRQFGFQTLAIMVQVLRQMLLAADGDPQPYTQQSLGGEENLQLQ